MTLHRECDVRIRGLKLGSCGAVSALQCQMYVTLSRWSTSPNFYASSLVLLHTECRIPAFYLFVLPEVVDNLGNPMPVRSNKWYTSNFPEPFLIKFWYTCTHLAPSKNPNSGLNRGGRLVDISSELSGSSSVEKSNNKVSYGVVSVKSLHF